MRGLSALVVWFGVVLFSAAGLLLLFYTAALLLPIILAVFAVSLVVGWYRQARIKKAFENPVSYTHLTLPTILRV